MFTAIPIFKNLLFLLLIGGIAISCNRKSVQSQQSNDTDITAVENLADFKPVEENLLASFRRTGCFGQCPMFRVSFYRGGVAMYTGENFVKNLGKHLGRFDESALNKIIREAGEAGFHDLEDFYPVDRRDYIPDLSNTITTLVLADSIKTVDHNHSGPELLLETEQKLQEMVDGIEWIEKK